MRVTPCYHLHSPSHVRSGRAHQRNPTAPRLRLTLASHSFTASEAASHTVSISPLASSGYDSYGLRKPGYGSEQVHISAINESIHVTCVDTN